LFPCSWVDQVDAWKATIIYIVDILLLLVSHQLACLAAMDGRGASASTDAGQDVWDWEEVLPDHMSSSVCHGSTDLSGKN
jgi:hypothetical protein